MEVDESKTLTPLPSVVHAGSIAISIFGLASFLSALVLFLHLTYKILVWHLGKGSGRSRALGHVFSSGPTEFGPAHDAARLAGSEPTVDVMSIPPSERTSRTRYPNQFLVLIANLLIADLHQATAFSLSTSWVARNSITVGTGTCFVQGLFVSVGDLASSCFMSAIAIHTFYSIVYKYRPPHKNLYLYIFLIWTFVYLISLLPLAGTHNGAAEGGYFVRAGAWVSHIPAI
ncbi:putative G-protein coupled receptor [Rosellinia necatrix]|uniref:Putative G-protein coupled receptor n=1 Tax=Rosellinia necatrix TaxID=77044 RepID=A0A1S8A945_ROSNE|nr:putative G-protein coupled receptor [Rosellinia necatrix]